MVPVPEPLVDALQPWSDLYAGSVLLSSGLEFLHLGSLVLAAGFALAFDRVALRAASRSTAERFVIQELTAMHRPVLLALSVVILSGLALFAADIEALLPAPIFWAKMGAILLLLLNGESIRRAGRRMLAEQTDARGWRALRRGATRSIILWLGLVLLGVLLTTVA